MPPADDSGEIGGLDTRWEGYANYQAVSKSVSKAVFDAFEAYTRVDSAHSEGARVKPRAAAEARAKIETAAYWLLSEIRREADVDPVYEEILNRWEGDGSDANPGFIRKFRDVELRRESPGWMVQFLLDMQTAAWELGYLKAGRSTTKGVEGNDAEEARREIMRLMGD